MTFFEAISTYWAQFAGIAFFVFYLGWNTHLLVNLARRFTEHRKTYYKNREEDAEKQAKKDADVTAAINAVKEQGSTEHAELAKKVDVVINDQKHQGKDIAEIKEMLKNK